MRDLMLRDGASRLLSMRLKQLYPHPEEGRRVEQPPNGGAGEPRNRRPV